MYAAFLPWGWRRLAADLAYHFHWSSIEIGAMTPGEFLAWHDHLVDVLDRARGRG